jgi:hypothetical protein
MNVNSCGPNLDRRSERLFPEIKHPPGPKKPVGVRRIDSANHALAQLGPILRGAGHYSAKALYLSGVILVIFDPCRPIPAISPFWPYMKA